MSSRRRFLRRIAAPALIGLTAKAQRPIAGGFVHDSFAVGHRLRDRAPFSTPKQTERIPIIIVGGGIAGLSAAWRLHKRGFRDFRLLEMEPDAGGNSRWGENEITAFPWAAHYVPVPDTRTALVRELFEELGVLRDGVWDERHLCFSPQERLFLHGRWQDGLEPETAATSNDRADYQRFARMIADFRATGQFTIPMDQGAKPSPLATQSFATWAAENKFNSPYLQWYLNYACRDDFGAPWTATSAWAGIHYFASREADESRKPEERGPLTWPEGNGWIARQLIDRVKPMIRTGSPVYSIIRNGARLKVRTESVEYLADRVIFAAPTFIASRILEDSTPADGFVYSPWLTANLTLDRLPREKGSELAWDNVIYDSPSLGYVVATHMSLRSRVDRSVWTYYWAFAERTPSEARQLLLAKDWGYWREAILNDLSRAHPDIRECVSRIDVMRIGHAMARPAPGFLSSASRRRFASAPGPVYYANSDLSGFSIFEEAQYRGVTAADRALKDLTRA